MRRAFVIASGPSLVLEDALWCYGAGFIIAVNSTIFSVPFADALFAADNSWWRGHAKYLGWLDQEKRFTTASTQTHVKVSALLLRRQKGKGIGGPLIEGENSGHQAISAAHARWGAKQIILLGFDCKFTDGKKHHHGDHPDRFPDGKMGCGNPQQVESWKADHLTLAADARKKGVEIINCSRDTALDCYERANLRDVIHGK